MSGKSLPTFPWSELLSWYEKNGRHHLPWRQYDEKFKMKNSKGNNYTSGILNLESGIYKIWLAEILLQQTQVDRVIPYFERILERYPTIHDLARASYEEFFPYYQGMGYYSRARNILRTAKIVSEEYGGVFPRDKKLLCKLPGVGGYTSSAILAFGYGDPYLAWDTNLEKVFARYYHGTRFEKLTDGEKEMVEDDFRKYVSKKGGQQKNGETEGGKLSESDDNNAQKSRASEFFHPSEPFDTFQLGKVWDESTIVRAINNALMDFAATVDLKNPENIDWQNYPIHSGVWYDTRGSLEPQEEKKIVTFPIPDATIVVILHQDHKVYYSARTHLTPQSPLLQRGEATPKTPSPLGEGRGEVYSPFILSPALHRDTRQYVQEYFRTRYELELSVRPVHAKWITPDGHPYIAVNAQIQAGIPVFSTYTKKEANIILSPLLPIK